MKKLIVTAAVAALVGGFIGVAATPNQTPDSCVLAFVKAEQLQALAVDAIGENSLASMRTLSAEVTSTMPVYRNLRDKCIAGE